MGLVDISGAAERHLSGLVLWTWRMPVWVPMWAKKWPLIVWEMPDWVQTTVEVARRQQGIDSEKKYVVFWNDPWIDFFSHVFYPPINNISLHVSKCVALQHFQTLCVNICIWLPVEAVQCQRVFLRVFHNPAGRRCYSLVFCVSKCEPNNQGRQNKTNRGASRDPKDLRLACRGVLWKHKLVEETRQLQTVGPEAFWVVCIVSPFLHGSNVFRHVCSG